MTNKLTLARQSLWDSIDNWSALENTFQKKVRNDEDLPALDPDKYVPEIDNVPAIAIWPTAENPFWFENTNQLVMCNYDVRVWTPGWRLELPESIALDLRRAFYQAHPAGDTRSYITIATCFSFPVVKWGFSRVRGGNAKKQNMTQLNMTVQLKFKDDPRT